MTFLNCPRCGSQSYEQYKSYTYCPQCNHSSEYELLEEETQTLRAVVRALGLQPKRLKRSSQNIWPPEVTKPSEPPKKFSNLGAATRLTPEPRSAVWAS